MSRRLRDIFSSAERMEEQAFQEFMLTVADSAYILKEMDPVKRVAFSTTIRNELYRRQDGKCALCGEDLGAIEDVNIYDVDHIIPYHYGGGNEDGNIQITHRFCNRSKGASIDPWDLLRYLESRARNF